MTSNILLVVQARVESQRFFGKVMRPLCGQPMIFWLLSRLASLPYPLVVALPSSPFNADLGAICERHGTHVVQVPGDPNDVARRFEQVMALYPGTEHIVRLCADCPLLDPVVIHAVIKYHLQLGTGGNTPGYTGLACEWGDGLADCDIFTKDALLTVARHATAAHHREHINPFFWEQHEAFTLAHYPCPFDLSHLRCSVDTKEDLLYVQMILERCLRWHGFGFGWREVWWQVEQDPQLRAYMERRPMNEAYLTQVGTVKNWKQERYGASGTPA